MRDLDTSVGLLPSDHPLREIKPKSGAYPFQERSGSGIKDTPSDSKVKAIVNVDAQRGEDMAIAKSLVEKGYVKLNADFVGKADGDLGLARDAFMNSIGNLPLDRDCDAGNRRRRYQVFYYHPWCRILESKPPTFDPDRKKWVMRFVQSAQLNPEHNGQPRAFAPFTVEQRINRFLRSTIERCHGCLGLDHTDSVIVGVHIIQLVATPGAPAASSPDHLHRDGEPWTWAFLLERRNVVGGENVMAPPEMANKHPSNVPDSQIFERFTLETPFAGWVVRDDKVSHYVAPVSVAGDNTIGWRTVLLLDFCRAVPELV